MPASFKPAPRTRSRVSNGNALFLVADARSVWARRFRDIVEAHVSDLGGADLLSEAQMQLCRRAGALALECERMEGDLAEGKEVDLDLLNRLCGGLGRLYERLGVKRVAKPVLTLAQRAAVATMEARS